MRITGVHVYTVNSQKNEDHDIWPQHLKAKKKKRNIRGKMETVPVVTQKPSLSSLLTILTFLDEGVLGRFSSKPGETSHTESSMSN